MKLKPFLFGLMTGGLAAGISFLLTAPNSGKVTRTQLRKNSQLVMDQLQTFKKNLLDLKDALVDATKEGRAQISTFLSEVKIVLANWEKEIRPHQQDLQKEIVEMKETIHELEEEISNSGK